MLDYILTDCIVVNIEPVGDLWRIHFEKGKVIQTEICCDFALQRSIQTFLYNLLIYIRIFQIKPLFWLLIVLCKLDVINE